MTHLEINKKIAELKGYEVRRVNDNQLFIGKPGFDGAWVNWSESISDAWELFEKMDQQIVMKDRYQGTYSKGKWLCTYETMCAEEVLLNGPQGNDSDALAFWQSPKFVVAADTAPLAICKAYIKRKELNSSEEK